ncbi:MAG: DMT family transporter [Clostridium sp.]|nr:DMT family transporter [Clostridium sp.]
MSFAIILSLLAGILIVVSRMISAALSNKIGVLSSTLFNYIIGLISTLILILFIKDINFNLSTLSNVPYYAYLGGALGVIVVSLSSYTSNKTTTFNFSIFCFLGQLFIGLIIDFISFDILSISKIVGGLFVLSGLVYNLKVEKQDSILTEINTIN